MKIKKLVSNFSEEIKKEVLKLLIESKFPLDFDDLKEKLNISDKELLKILSALEYEGYDIKTIISGGKTKISLVRHGSFEKEQFFKIFEVVKFPCLITSDWHIGSKGFSYLAYKELVKDCKKYKIKTLLHAGDLLQGLGVFKVEAMEVIEPSIDKQEEMAINLLNELPKYTKKFLIIGNHEEKLKGAWTVGHDPIKFISFNVENCTYFGHTAKFQIEKTKFTAMMFHGSGAPSYAWSYMSQKILRNLTEKPTFLITGHLHQLGIWNFPPCNYVFAAGTLQRASSYLLQKGIHSVIGWIIVNKFDGKFLDAIVRTPEIF